MRMKAAFVFLAMVFSGVSAFAGVGIIWTTLWGAYDHTAIDLTGEDHALLDGFCAIWQLVYAGPNHVADPPWVSVGGPGIADDYVSGDDVVWAQRVLPLGGGFGNDAPYNTVWNNWMQNEGGSVVYTDSTWFTEGYVFQRVFEGIPVFTSWYYQSPLLAINTGYSRGWTRGARVLSRHHLCRFSAGTTLPLGAASKPVDDQSGEHELHEFTLEWEVDHGGGKRGVDGGVECGLDCGDGGGGYDQRDRDVQRDIERRDDVADGWGDGGGRGHHANLHGDTGRGQSIHCAGRFELWSGLEPVWIQRQLD